MLKLKHATLLARVKLHQRPLRLAVPLIFITLLFGTVFLGLSAIKLLENQVNTLARSGTNGRHLVAASVMAFNESLRYSPAIQARAEELYKEAVKRNTALAKQFNVTYDPESEESPFEIVYGQKEFNPYTKYAQMAIAEWHEQNNIQAGIDDLKRMSAPYGGFNITTAQALVPRDSFNALVSGKENLRRITHPWTDWQTEPIRYAYVMDVDLVKDFIFDNIEQLDLSNKIPVIMPYTVMAAQLGLENPENEPDVAKKSDLMQHIQERSIGHEFTICFRNSVSQSRIFNAVEAEFNDDKPLLEYGLPTEPCGVSPVVKDRRTAAEKDYDRRFQEFQLAIGTITETDPVQEILIFTVIGLADEQIADDQTDFTGLIQRLSKRTISGPTIPSNYYERLNNATIEKIEQVFTSPTKQSMGLSNTSYIVEFNNRETADRFITENTCANTEAGCSTQEKPFLLAHFSVNAALLDQIITQTSRASRLIMLVGTGLVVLFALVIIVLLLINDRREIAIFRAIGYKRNEIMQIYLTFAVLLATIIIIGALLIGSIAGFVLNIVFYDTLSITLRTLFNAPDATIILPLWSWTVVGQVIVIGYSAVLVGSILPIFLNSRASIISAIRAE